MARKEELWLWGRHQCEISTAIFAVRAEKLISVGRSHLAPRFRLPKSQASRRGEPDAKPKNPSPGLFGLSAELSDPRSWNASYVNAMCV